MNDGCLASGESVDKKIPQSIALGLWVAKGYPAQLLDEAGAHAEKRLLILECNQRSLVPLPRTT
jgi:hypothetical protein